MSVLFLLKAFNSCPAAKQRSKFSRPVVETTGEVLVNCCKVVQCFLPVLGWRLVLVPLLIMLEAFFQLQKAASMPLLKISLKWQDVSHTVQMLYGCITAQVANYKAGWFRIF